MKIVIENTRFDFNLGCRLLKLKHDKAPFKEVEDVWDDIKPLTFREIAEMENLEHRRIGMLCLGIERLISQVSPILVDSQTVRKQKNFIEPNGNNVNESFDDTYELYRVAGSSFGSTDRGRDMEDCYFVKVKDTSTDRNYLIWVEPRSVFETNRKEEYAYWNGDDSQINAIQAIAWTMQTDVEVGNIEKIIRQGDCVLVKPIDPSKQPLKRPRHLTENEYRTLLVAES